MKKLDNFNIIFAGVGGQGVLTIAGVVARAALIEGYNVKAAELHGLSMRFGALETHLRFGQKIFSPLVKKGDADLVVSLEPVETVRVCHYSNKNTNYVFDRKEFIPNIVHLEKKVYPSLDKVLQTLKKASPKGKIIDVAASDIARENYGSVVAANVVLVGRAVAEGVLPLKKISLFKGMAQVFPAKLLDINKKIFELGFSSK